MADYMQLARQAYGYAEDNYGKKGARYDTIVECWTNSEIAEMLRVEGITTKAGALKWADREAGLQHEKELNQAEDGPESCIGSEYYEATSYSGGDEY